MQLPPPQLTEALSMCKELKEPLREHLLSFTESQRAHIPPSVQEIVLATSTPTPVTEQASWLIFGKYKF